jgi:hypothetical protein
MKELKLFESSRYSNLPKVFEEGSGFMALPFCPEFTTLYSHTIRSHDTISGLAREYYGDSRFQWAILSANELPFPPRLEMGKTLYIPSPDEVYKYVE